MPQKSDHDLLLEVHSTLLGTNGQGGLYRQVEKNTKAIARLYIIIAIIIAGGGGGGYALAHAVLAKVAGG